MMLLIMAEFFEAALPMVAMSMAVAAFAVHCNSKNINGVNLLWKTN